MTTYVFLVLCLLVGLGWMVLTQPPKRVAAIVVNSGPFLLMGLGILLLVLRRGVIGLPLLFIGLSWLRRRRPMGRMPGQKAKKSKVRTAHLEMELDHDTGEMDGTILTGSLKGVSLSTLSEQQIFDLWYQFQADGDSVALLESYLDRYHPEWRENSNADSFEDSDGTSSNLKMSREEACQILGVDPAATREEILEAWRRLIKRVHPDHGGSAFLTAKINAAKDVLLG